MAFDVPPAAPTFPTAFLNVTTEIQVNGVWQDISSSVYQGTTTVGRGHPDESTTASPSTFSATLDNSTGNFSQLNPAGIYYPYLGLNTPIRTSVPEGASYLRLENDAVSYAQGPTSTALGSGLDVQIDLTPDNWFTPQIFAAQYNSTGNERSWAFGINGSGQLFLAVSGSLTAGATFYSYAPFLLDPNGAGGNVQVNPHQRMSVRVVYTAGTGLATYYYGSFLTGWTAIGGAVTAPATGPSASTAPITIGCCPSNDLAAVTVAGDTESFMGVQGKIHAALVQTLGSTVIANPDFTQLTAGVTSFADGAGNTWTTAGTAEISTRKYRFHGAVAAWPQSWKPGAANTLVALSAGGQLRRMGSSQATVNSPMYRAYNRGVGSSANLAAYWTMEDGAAATSLASGIGGTPMQFSGNPTLASSSNFVCSTALPVVNGALLFGRVPAQPSGSWSANTVRFLMQIPSGETNNSIVAQFSTTGQIAAVELQYTTTGGGTLTMFGIASNGTLLFSPSLSGITNQLLAVQVDVTAVGAAITATLSTLQANSSVPTVVTGTTSGVVGAVQQVLFNPNGPVSNTGIGITVIGHCAVYTQLNPITAIAGALAAWNREPAGLRFQRFCGEETIQFRGMGSMADTVLMGNQTEQTVAALLQECADADRGMWFEPRQCLGFAYRNRVSMGNQVPWVTFDYTQDHLTDDLLPTHDDQTVKNDVTVSNADGSSAEATLNDGSPLSIGVIGRYDTSISVNLNTDWQLPDEAGWILHALTVNEPRYTAINTDLANHLASFVAMFYQILDMDIGDRINVINPPVWLPPGVIDQIVQGATETLSLKDLTEAWNGVPATPFNVMYLDDLVYGRLDTDSSSLSISDLTGTATSLSVATAAGFPLWTTAAADFPFNISIAGEVITVTNITGTSSPQTFTVTRSVNGVVKPQLAGADVRLAVQPTLSL